MSQIGQGIARQIGQRAFTMMGTGSNKWVDTNCLIFGIKGSKWHKVRIILTPMDTYDIEFFKIAKKTYEVTSYKIADVYADQLHEVIERETGLYLSL